MLQRARACFADLARLRDEVRLGLDGEQAAVFDELSMGMSEDWHEAIAEGATIVRIGEPCSTTLSRAPRTRESAARP